MSAKKIGVFEIPVPTIEEQKQIVAILDKLFVKYNELEGLRNELEQIELLKKSILAKAFRGELGTNDVDEISSKELLKSILSE